MKVIDITTFFSELEIIKIRLYELQDLIDSFVILEMNQTHLGIKKPCRFFEYWNDINTCIKKENRKKISYYCHNFPDYISKDNHWGREFYQRNHLADCLKKLNLNDDDLILMSDCDEIASRKSIMEAIVLSKSCDVDIFGIPIYYQPFFLNVRTGPATVGVRCFKYKMLKEKTLQDIRHISDENLYKTKNFGWHLSFQGGPKQIKIKSSSFVHGEDYIDSFKCFAKDISIEQQKEQLDLLLENHIHPISNHPWQFLKPEYPNVPYLVVKLINDYTDKGMIAPFDDL